MTTPQIVAQVSVPLILSFSDPTDPQLTLTLTLVNCSTPITTPVANQLLFPVVNCLSIREADTGKAVELPTIDINMKTRPPLKLSSDQEHRFLTLHPGVPHVHRENIRPFGHEIFTRERIAAMGSKRYRILTLGMHLLKTGQRYTMSVKDDRVISRWMEGDKKDLIPGEWEPRTDRIRIEPAEAVSFRVEE